MLELVNSLILTMQNFILFFVIMGILMLILHLVLCLHLKVTNKRIAYMGLFFGLSKMDAWILGTIFLRVSFVVWCVCNTQAAVLIDYLFYATLSLIIIGYILLRKGGIADLLGTILVAIGILTGDVLLDYNRQIVYEVAIVYVYWFLGVFTILYSIFISLRAIEKMSIIRRERNAED